MVRVTLASATGSTLFAEESVTVVATRGSVGTSTAIIGKNVTFQYTVGSPLDIYVYGDGTSGTGTVSTGGTLTFSGTNGVTASASGATITIGTPQDLRSNASPTFSNLTVSNSKISTSTATGALTVAGGLGVGGNVWAGNVYADNMFFANGATLSSVISGGVTGYTLPTATTSVLGGVKIGNSIAAAVDGTIDVLTSGLSTATSSTVGVVKPGYGLSVGVDGSMNLGANGNVHITGCSSGQYLQTDGSGTTSWVAQSGGGGLTIGTTTITSGTTTKVLYDNAGILGEYTITGTAGSVVLSTSPTFTGAGGLRPILLKVKLISLCVHPPSNSNIPIVTPVP